MASVLAKTRKSEFEDFLARYGPLLEDIAKRIFRQQPELAEDLVQEALMRILIALTKGNGPLSNEKAWCRGILKNTLADMFRRPWYRQKRQPLFIKTRDSDCEQVNPQIMDSGKLSFNQFSPLSGHRMHEALAAVVQAIKDLPERDGIIAVARLLENKRFQDIADTCGTCVNTIRNRLFDHILPFLQGLLLQHLDHDHVQILMRFGWLDVVDE